MKTSSGPFCGRGGCPPIAQSAVISIAFRIDAI